MSVLSLRRSAGRAVAVLATLSVWCATPGAAQQTLRGTVLRGGTGVGDIPVTMHQVTRDTAGAVATARTDATGRFTLPFPKSDSVAGFNVVFVTAEYQGVRYFGPPVHSGEPPPGYAVTVYDTATVPESGEAVRLVRRDLVLFPQPNGGWEVNEVLLFANDSARTWVAPLGQPTWTFALPNGVGAFEAGEGSVDPDEVVRMDERVLVLAPVPPGRHQLMVRYRLAPASARAAFALPAPADSVRVLVQQPAPPVQVEGLRRAPTVEAAGAHFVQFAGGSLPARHAVVLSWPRTAAPVDPRFAAVGTAAFVLLGGVVAALRNGKRRRRRAP